MSSSPSPPQPPQGVALKKHPALRVKQQLNKRGTISGSTSQKDKQDSEFGHKETQKKMLERRASVTNDGKELPVGKQSLDVYYDILHLLGQGVSSQVFLAQHKKTKQYVAIKVIPKKILINNLDLAREIRILKQINHRYIVKLYDVFLTPEHLQLVMEACEGQELFDEICTRRTFTEEDVKDIILKILDAVGYLHMNNIAHRDLKPENIMFVVEDDGTKNLKIIDFGFASKTDQPNLLDTAAGTLGYIAPEVLRQEPATSQADMWSIGVIAYILLVGFPPFLSHADDDDPNTLMNAPFWTLFNERTDMLVDAIKQGRVNFAPVFWDNLKEAKEFVSGLLKADPKERMTAAQALKHPWLKTIKRRDSVDESSETARSRSSSQVEPADLSTKATSSEEAATSPEKLVTEEVHPAEIETQVKTDSAGADSQIYVPQSTAQPASNEQSIESLAREPEPQRKTSAFSPRTPSSPAEPRTMFLNRLRKLQKQATLRVKTESKENLGEVFTETFAPSGITELDSIAGNAEDAENLQTHNAAEDEDDDTTSAPASPQMNVNEEQRLINSAPNPIINPEVKSDSKPLLTLSLPSLQDLKASLSENDELHEWKKIHFKGPTWCAVCDEFIWGVISKTGYKCKYCKAEVHSHCKDKYTLHCDARKPKIEKPANSPRGRQRRQSVVLSPRKIFRSTSKDEEKPKISRSASQDEKPPASPSRKEEKKEEKNKLLKSPKTEKAKDKKDKDKDKDKDKSKKKK